MKQRINLEGQVKFKPDTPGVLLAKDITHI